MTGGLDWTRLGHRLADSRGERTQKEVAAAAKVSERMISAYENGERVQVSRQLRKLVAFYGWPTGEIHRLLGEEGAEAVAPTQPGDPEKAARALLDGDPTPRQIALLQAEIDRAAQHEV